MKSSIRSVCAGFSGVGLLVFGLFSHLREGLQVEAIKALSDPEQHRNLLDAAAANGEIALVGACVAGVSLIVRSFLKD